MNLSAENIRRYVDPDYNTLVEKLEKNVSVHYIPLCPSINTVNRNGWNISSTSFADPRRDEYVAAEELFDTNEIDELYITMGNRSDNQRIINRFNGRNVNIGDLLMVYLPRQDKKFTKNYGVVAIGVVTNLYRGIYEGLTESYNLYIKEERELKVSFKPLIKRKCNDRIPLIIGRGPRAPEIFKNNTDVKNLYTKMYL